MKTILLLACYLLTVPFILAANPPTMEEIYRAAIAETNYVALCQQADQWAVDLKNEPGLALFGTLIRGIDARATCVIDTIPHDTEQDLTIEGGRCAWIIERLIGCRIPTVTASSSKIDLSRSRSVALRRVQARAAPPPSKYATDTSVETRRALAANPRTNKATLAELSRDPDSKVRLAIAANPQTPVSVLAAMIRRDSLPTVRQQAVKNLEAARSDLP